MKTTRTAAINAIAAQMIKSAPAGTGSYQGPAREFFDDLVDAVADMIVVLKIDGPTYARTALTEVGFSGDVAANLARAVMIELDKHQRCSVDYIDGVAFALNNSNS